MGNTLSCKHTLIAVNGFQIFASEFCKNVARCIRGYAVCALAVQKVLKAYYRYVLVYIKMNEIHGASKQSARPRSSIKVLLVP